jgi:hypothetical protein
MQHVRRTFLAPALAVVAAFALVAHPLDAQAKRLAPWADPTPTQPAPTGGPTAGEPDAGSTRGTSTSPTLRRDTPAETSQYSLATMRMIGWSAVIWLRAHFGIGGR